MEKILVSACLLGENVKYDGGNNKNPLVIDLLEKYEIVPFCPEVEGGLSVPRNPSEQKEDKVYMNNGKDVTEQFQKGAQLALNICKYLGIKIAVLKARSPSCGNKQVYDGSFSHTLKDGMGVTAELLTKNGILVINEEELDAIL